MSEQPQNSMTEDQFRIQSLMRQIAEAATSSAEKIAGLELQLAIVSQSQQALQAQVQAMMQDTESVQQNESADSSAEQSLTK